MSIEEFGLFETAMITKCDFQEQATQYLLSKTLDEQWIDKMKSSDTFLSNLLTQIHLNSPLQILINLSSNPEIQQKLLEKGCFEDLMRIYSSFKTEESKGKDSGFIKSSDKIEVKQDMSRKEYSLVAIANLTT